MGLAYHGPYTVLGDPHPADESHTSFRSQISSVFRHPHKQDLYIALADRWLPALSAEESSQAERFRAYFSGEQPDAMTLPEVDTSIADYVWLPVRFVGDMPGIDWHDEWRLEDFA